METEADEWIPKYRNDSRRWIVCEDEEKTKWTVPDSTSKSTYVKPDENDFRTIGRRKKLYRRFFLNEAKLQPPDGCMIDEQSTPIYKTEYMYHFSRIQIKNKEYIQDCEKSELQYPVHTNEPAVSFWQQNINSIHGVTKPCNPKHLFHKNTFFTKPIDEILDDPFAKQNSKLRVEKWQHMLPKFRYK